MNRRSWIRCHGRAVVVALLSRAAPASGSAPAASDSSHLGDRPQAGVAPPPLQPAQPRRSGRRRSQARDTTATRVYKERIEPHWFAENDRFWYRNDLPAGRVEFIVVDALAGTKAPAFDHARLAKSLSVLTGRTVRADRLPIDALVFDAAPGALLLYNDKQAWELDLASYAVRNWKGPLPSLQSLPAGRRPHPSNQTGPDTVLTFVNETAAPVHLFWIDSGGEERDYGSVAAESRRTMHTFAGHVWLVTDPEKHTLGVFEATEAPASAVIGPDAGKIEAAPPEPSHQTDSADQAGERRSPDHEWAAFYRENNVWLRRVSTGEEFALSHDGKEGDRYEDSLSWSPDSRWLVFLRTISGDDHRVNLVESSPPDQVQPRLHSIYYLKPGDKIPLTRPHLFDVSTRQEIPIDDALFPNPWSIEDLRWQPDSKRFTFYYNQRGHQALRIIGVDAQTGRPASVIDETSPTFIDYAGKHSCQHLDDTGEILWMSERDGWNHLYLYDAVSGAVKNQVTRGPWVVRSVDRVDTAARQVWFRAGGIYPDQDPYHVHFCRVNFDGTGLVTLTEGDGTHSITYSPDSRFFIDTWSRVDLPPETELRRSSDGKRVCKLESADARALIASGWQMPERFVSKGRDGETDIYGVIIRPIGFQPDRSYPVVENIYAGPQSSYVPKAWSSHYGMQDIAAPGCVVVQIDGMGTSNRSKAFHDVCWKNLADAGFPDRIPWIKAAARRYRFMDLSWVGIYGGSAGGQNALGALLFHGDFYKVAVADSGCHDNRMDKIWWNELWMGWPVGPEYAEQSNVTNAHRLQGDLMLVVGEMDNNVDPSSTMQVVNALIKADKEFELLYIPGAGHGCAETPYGSLRRKEFLDRHLLREPGHGQRLRPA